MAFLVSGQGMHWPGPNEFVSIFPLNPYVTGSRGHRRIGLIN